MGSKICGVTVSANVEPKLHFTCNLIHLPYIIFQST